MKRVTLFICVVLTCLVSLAGDIKRVSITYDYVSNDPTISLEQAKQMALYQAKQRALEENFGLDVVGITSALQHSRVEGQDASSVNDVINIRETIARGEWIETLEEKFIEETYSKPFWHIRVRVVGNARARSTNQPEIFYQFINNAHDRDNRAMYYDGDAIFMRFKAPVSGALCVYLVDAENMAYCLLPYLSITNGCYQIEANKDYLLFSQEEERLADEYTLNCQKNSEQNALYVIFSPNQFTKAIDHQAGQNWRGEQMPRELSYVELMKWLARNQKQDDEMVVRHEIITIKKK